MPLYEFLCTKCGHEFEERTGYDAEAVQCPHCDSYKTEKLPSLIGGYRGDMGSASTTPKQARAFKTRKVKK
jgi:putative FmdB family regulatory protein